MIKVITGSVHITEDTLRSLLKAVEVARQSIPFLKDPDVGLPGSDMSDDELIRQRSIRGNILVRSCCIECEDFWINIELPGKVRGESAGYKLCYPERLEDEDIEEGLSILGREVRRGFIRRLIKRVITWGHRS